MPSFFHLFVSLLFLSLEKCGGNEEREPAQNGNQIKIEADFHDIEPEVRTNWGVWGPMVQCSNRDHFVQAFKVKIEAAHGPFGDDTAANAIRFYCGDPFDPYKPYSEELVSLEGPWGKYYRVFTWEDCERKKVPFFRAFRLEVERPQKNGDETATNSIGLACVPEPRSDGGNEGSWVQSFSRYWGDFGFQVACNKGYAICGLKTQVEPEQGKGDDSALNRVIVRCCKMRRYEELMKKYYEPLAFNYGDPRSFSNYYWQ